MKRILRFGTVAVVALAAAGLAVAEVTRDRGISEISFAVNGTSSEVKSRTCTGVDGTYVVTRAVYVGTATGLYDGAAARLRLESVVNTTEGVGLATGTLHLREDDALQAKAHVRGTIDGGTLTGTINGRDVRGSDRGHLVANFSATLGGNAIAMTAGSGSAANHAVLFGGMGCGARPVLTGALGSITVISSTSITVATSGGAVTCSLTSEQAQKIADRFEVGDRVSIRCDASARLVEIDRRR